jgi:hypothetical protein
MRLKKTVIAVSIVGCLILFEQAQCVEITPSNMVLPTSAGEIFSFDFVISDDMDTNAVGFQATINVSGPSSLVFNESNSIAVIGDIDYWVFGNSGGVIITTPDVNSYGFADDPLSGLPEPLSTDDIMARYAFIWDGTEGDYTFVLDLDTQNSFIQNENFEVEALEFTPGPYDGNYNSFTIIVPEPGTLVIFALGGTVLLKKRNK